jgi:hypothetical protein
MMMWQSKWNDLETPENWNVSCLSLLLDADKAYLERKKTETPETGDTTVKGLLLDSHKQLFERIASYKMLELNLKTTLTAKVGWKPDKTTMPLGPVVTCRTCKYPRSVTMMGRNGQCGNCLADDYKSAEERQECIEGRVSKDDNASTDAIWVECFIQTCRAQYVVYNTERLNVRAKCHYCREQSSLEEAKRSNNPAPWLECEQCLNRVIYPKEYRIGDMANYKCVGCTSGRKTIVEIETTAEKLSKENGTGWLLENKSDKLKEPLGGRSLFHQITQAGTEDFCKKVILFPNAEKRKITRNGKLIRNTPDLIAQLSSWVSRRRTEAGTCSLCFSDIRKGDLNPACGRRGCEQRICRNCLGGWYGLNAAGRIINTAALSCPFCRRTPTAKTLHSYGMGIHAVADLRDAVENSGQWVYAWCFTCSTAKQYLERVCAAGAPPELKDWDCESCAQARREAAEREAQELAAEITRLEQAGRRMDYEARMEAQRAVERARAVKKGLDKQSKLVLRECPFCKAMTEKSYGCGHMTCICGKHWCWFCGKKSSSSEIYSHMEEVHGGFFGDDDDAGDSDEE